MNKVWVGIAGLVATAMAMPAGAADLPARIYTKAPAAVSVAYDWSGFYVGANGGYATTTNCWFAKGAVGALAPEAAEGCQQPAGFVVGGQAGYNWQLGKWVIGVEARGNWAELSDTGPSATLPSDLTSRVHSLGLFTGRLGYAWDNSTLLYIKGGAAVVRQDYHFQNRLVPAIFASATESRVGSTAGAGVEVGITPNWSVGFEYDHLFLGKRDMTFDPIVFLVGLQAITAMKQNEDLFTVRVNYRFGGTGVRY